MVVTSVQEQTPLQAEEIEGPSEQKSEIAFEAYEFIEKGKSPLRDDYYEDNKRIPGGIVPLGVRTDKGSGPLASAAASVQEMDEKLRELMDWKTKHQSKLKSLESKYASEFENIYAFSGKNEDTELETEEFEGEIEEEIKLMKMPKRLTNKESGFSLETHSDLHVHDEQRLTDAELHLLKFSDIGVSVDLNKNNERHDITKLLSQEFDAKGYDSDGTDGMNILEDDLVEWNAEIDSVLAKMDSLKS